MPFTRASIAARALRRALLLATLLAACSSEDPALVNACAYTPATACPEPDRWPQSYVVGEDPKHGPAPRNDDCQPALCTACQSACDCKFVMLGCRVGTANKSMPWNAWDAMGGGSPNCFGVSCGSTEGPPKGSTTACVAGQCVIHTPEGKVF